MITLRCQINGGGVKINGGGGVWEISENFNKRGGLKSMGGGNFLKNLI